MENGDGHQKNMPPPSYHLTVFEETTKYGSAGVAAGDIDPSNSIPPPSFPSMKGSSNFILPHVLDSSHFSEAKNSADQQQNVDKLNQILDSTPEILFVQPRGGVSVCGSSGEIVQIQDNQGHLLMSTIFMAGDSRGGAVSATAGVTKFSDPTGQLLMTAAEEFRTFTVTSSSQVTIGVVEGCGLFASNVTAKTLSGHPCFRSINRNGMKTFIGPDGSVLGTLGRKKGGKVTLKIDPHTDPKVKILLLVAAFNLFLFHLARTVCCGVTGVRRARIIWFLSLVTCVLLITALIILMPFFS